MNTVTKTFGSYNINWGEELVWAVALAFCTGAASVFLAGQGTMDRTTFLSAVVAAGARPAIAILGTRVAGAVSKLTASPAASSRFQLSTDGKAIVDVTTGMVYGPLTTQRVTTIPASPPPTIGGSA